jgi:hypothetical protein
MNNEIRAAKIEGKRWCKDCKNKEKSVKIKVRAIDKAGKKFIRNRGWISGQVIREWKCSNT